MLFNSLDFLIFFPIVIALYFYLPHKYRWIWLLMASYYFYMCWNVQYIFLIIGSTVVDYFTSLQIQKSETKRTKKLWLSLSLLSNLGILFLFKYFNFFNESIGQIFSFFSLPYEEYSFSLLLPVGISFYTFQTMAYTIDVYREKLPAERHFGRFALYVSFFPQLVAGPIERATSLLPQFWMKVQFDYQRIADGLKLMAWGLFKKVVIADRLAVYVNEIYAVPQESGSLQLLIATYFFAFQIYCDFSGYSDIAIGASQVLGFKLMDNFKRPYFSKSIAEFWGRWHISLSTWFRDYLYIPLGGNRVNVNRHLINLMAVFIISGLWHGASWTFVIWGALHGLYLVVEVLLFKKKSKVEKIDRSMFSLNKIVKVLLTFHLVLFAWVFFRSTSIADAFYVIGSIFSFDGYQWSDLTIVKFQKNDFIIAMAAILFMELIHLTQSRLRMRSFLSAKPVYIKWPIYTLLILLIVFFGVFDQQEFLYFQF